MTRILTLVIVTNPPALAGGCLVTVIGMVGLNLSFGAAVLLGSILAPTDPVLASDVQVENDDDHDQMRFSLSGETGLNDGIAFPFVILGLGVAWPT